MNRKDIEKTYHLIGTNDNINLYKDYKYRGSIALKNGKAYITAPISFTLIGFSDVESLEKRLNELAEELEFDIDTYDPQLDTRYRIERRIHQHLVGLGFKENRENFGTLTYIKTLGANLNANISVIMETSDKKVDIAGRIYYRVGEWSVDQHFKDEREAIKIIDSFITLQMLEPIGGIVGLLNEVGDIDAVNADMYKINWATLNTEHQSFKDVMIEVLEKQIEKLKALK